MKRSVIQIANSTYLVSLPRPWIKRFEVKKGDELEVEDKGNHIMVTTDKGISIDTSEIDISKLPDMIKDILYGLYKVGYTEVKLKYDDPKQTEKIQRVLQSEMVGFEIIEQRSNYCIIKSIAGGFETEFDNMFRRTFLLVKSMAEDIYTCMQKQDMSPVGSIKLLEVNTNKYTAFCRRIIQKKGYKDMKSSILMYMIVEELEKIADEYKYLCDYFTDSKGKAIKNIKPEILKLFKQLNDYIENVYSVYYSFDLKEVNNLFKWRKRFINEIHKAVTPKTGHEGRLGHYLVNIAQQLTNILSYKLDMEL